MEIKDKIKDKEEIIKVAQELKNQGKKIVTTNGAFDLIHRAHLNFLQKAKALGDILIVLLNSDDSVKKYKGDKRPIFTEKERALHLAHLAVVDFVAVFQEDKPLSLLQAIKPDIHAKGGSFIPERIKEEKELLESWGGKFKGFEFEERYSSSRMIQRILNKFSA